MQISRRDALMGATAAAVVAGVPGAGDDDRRLLDLDGHGFANISDLENKKFRPFRGTDVVGHHVPVRKLVQHVTGADNLRRLALDLNLDRAPDHVDYDVAGMEMIVDLPAGSDVEQDDVGLLAGDAGERCFQ